MSEKAAVAEVTEATDINKKRRRAAILTAAGFVLTVVLMLIIRLYVFNGDIMYAIKEGAADGYYTPAHISDNGVIFCNYMSVRDLYLTGLSCCFKLCGNVDKCIFVYDICLECAALIFVFFACKRIFGRIAAFVISLIAACYPALLMLSGIFLGSIYVLLWRDDRILYLGGAVILWILSFIVGGIKKSVRKKKMRQISADDDISIHTDQDAEDNTEMASDDLKSGCDYPVTDTIEVKLEDKQMTKDNEDPAFGPEINVVLSEAGMLIDKLEEKKEVEYLISPLPGPKKPRHRELDYDYEVDEDKMKYDVEIDDTAEFDHE